MTRQDDGAKAIDGQKSIGEQRTVTDGEIVKCPYCATETHPSVMEKTEWGDLSCPDCEEVPRKREYIGTGTDRR